MRTQEQRDAAKRRRDARKLRKQQEVGTVGDFDTRETRRRSTTDDPRLLNETMLIREIKRIPLLERNWDYNMTIPVKKEMLRRVQVAIDSDTSDDLSTIAFDVLYELKKEGSVIENSGCLGSAEEVLEQKREKRMLRKAKKMAVSGVTPSNYREELKNENNPLHSPKHVVRFNHGNNKPGSKKRETTQQTKGDTTMILTNTKTSSVYKFKVRGKGAPAYAEAGDNRPAKIDGVAVNLVLNPKQENNKSKRVGFDWNGKWYFVDDETVHGEVKGTSAKSTITLEAKKPAEKKERKPKAEKPVEAAPEPKATKGSKKAPAKAAPKGKGKKAAAAAPAE